MFGCVLSPIFPKTTVQMQTHYVSHTPLRQYVYNHKDTHTIKMYSKRNKRERVYYVIYGLNDVQMGIYAVMK